nr:hypothetical protein [Tanacetum cinerariifolium]
AEQQDHLQPDAATRGDAHESPTLQLVLLMLCSLGVASSGLFRGGVSASGIPALQLVDSVDRGIGNNGGVPDGCSE